MGGVYEEFERELAAWRRRDAGRPRREMVRLLLLALEREELVSVGYREAMIARRLRTMPIEPPVRALIHHALAWAWKDEEMHAIYLRGAIFRLGSRSLRARAYLRQLAGAVAGWASSVRQHVRWREAPLARACATQVTWMGTLLGRVPRDVRQYLRYRPFRDFCRLNVDAEKTARLCYDRMIELAAELPELPAALLDDFRRVRDDEVRHTRIFEILEAALDPADRLVPGESAATLTRKIAAVGEVFLPRAHRAALIAENPLGEGGRVWVARGATAAEKLPLFGRLLEDSGLADRLRRRAEALGKPLGELRVAIKPTFMLGYHRDDRSILTDPDLLDALAARLRAIGCGDVAVVEATNIYDRFYGNRSVAAVAHYFGIASPHYRLVDLAAEQVAHVYGRGMAQYSIGRTWKEADFRISFGKMRSHPVELAYLTVGNVEWIGARCDEFLFAERQAHRQTAIMMLLDEFPPHYALLDAYDRAAEGLVGVMGCPRPPAPRRLYAGGDALAVDVVAARHMGVRNPRESSILRAACHWFGDPSDRIEVIGPDEPLVGWRGPYHSELSTLLSFVAFPVYTWGSGRGALFVPEMDEEAFPPLRPEGRLLRLGRRGVRRLLGLRHGRTPSDSNRRERADLPPSPSGRGPG
ncbi:MAG TPA: DUF362 domain-containing protein [Isosphaeraceae bacterium]|jgi:uncharacterized protein (DUF362 family)